MTTAQSRCADEIVFTGFNAGFGGAIAYLFKQATPFYSGFGVGIATIITTLANKILTNIFPNTDHLPLVTAASLTIGCFISAHIFSLSLFTLSITMIASSILTLGITSL